MDERDLVALVILAMGLTLYGIPVLFYFGVHLVCWLRDQRRKHILTSKRK
jgi:hypothetical protein